MAHSRRQPDTAPPSPSQGPGPCNVVMRTETLEPPLLAGPPCNPEWEGHPPLCSSCSLCARPTLFLLALPHALTLDPIYSCRITQKTNALVCRAHRDGLPVTLNPFSQEHIIVAVSHPRRHNAAHALLAVALVGPRLSLEPPLPMPWRLSLGVDCDTQLGRQLRLAKDALATTVQQGGTGFPLYAVLPTSRPSASCVASPLMHSLQCMLCVVAAASCLESSDQWLK